MLKSMHQVSRVNMLKSSHDVKSVNTLKSNEDVNHCEYSLVMT